MIVSTKNKRDDTTISFLKNLKLEGALKGPIDNSNCHKNFIHKFHFKIHEISFIIHAKSTEQNEIVNVENVEIRTFCYIIHPKMNN